MSTENKKDENRKIIPIRFPYDTSDDPEIDDFILKNLQEEADEIERRMNEDPDFEQSADSDDGYEKIVARLKEMGEWEEEENSSEPNSDEDDDVYRLLSEDDRQALELGRREQRRQEKKKARRSQFWRFAARGVAAAAAFVLLFNVSMNVGASRRVILRMWDTVADVLATRTATNNLEDSVQSTVAESLAAMEKIEEATGIPGLNFVYWPDGMEYLQFEIQDENAAACVFYSYEGHILQLYLQNVDTDMAMYFAIDNDTVLEKTADNWLEAEVSIWSINSNQESKQYLAEFEYGDYRYVILGCISLEELENLVKGVDFLS
ncbi:MAG: DUF4367 domain-containing protein [Clostridiales bacterium]|nr:DUF4367 domain-containing protein [Clostridiales bacterium]